MSRTVAPSAGWVRTSMVPSRRSALGASMALVGWASARTARAQPKPTLPTSELREVTTPAEAVIATQYGPVRGYRYGQTYTFKGIPYGADTSGLGRFQPPRAPQPWTDTRLALAYGPACPQQNQPASGEILRFIAFADDRFQSEDCLNLNVWSPSVDPGSRLPVLVWLHGGGFAFGNSREQLGYDGTNLARRGAVVVSVNHRLGALGFADLSGASPEFAASGNVGMLDLVAALKWVQTNIASFGGDPTRVTLFGQSGGGAKVSTLLAMPAARGLFHRAVVMSGSPSRFARPERSLALGRQLLAAAGAVTPSDLQRLDVNAVIAAGEHAVPAAFGHSHPLAWQPVLDGRYIVQDWERGAPDTARGVPLMVGNVRDEFRNFDSPALSDAERDAQLARYGVSRAALVAAIRNAFPQSSNLDVVSIANALIWRQHAVEQANKQAATGARVYCYWYVRPSPLLDGRIGVPHGSEVDLFFDNVASQPALTGYRPDAYSLAEAMSGALVTFAATGRAASGTLDWRPFSAGRVDTMVFDRHWRMVADPLGAGRRIAAATPGFDPFG